MSINCAVLFVIINLGRCICNLVNHIDVETTPVLTLLPDYHWFLIGESVTLNCLVPNESKKQYFTFFKDYISISTQSSSTFEIQRLENSDGGLYTCEILQNNSKSIKSNIRPIHVYALPPPPIISLKPLQDIYMAGKRVAVICSTFKNHELNLFRFYRNGQIILSLKSHAGEAILNITTSLSESRGAYSCDYQTKRLGKWIKSAMREVSVIIAAGQTAEDGTTSTSFRLTSEFQTIGEVIKKTQEFNKSTASALLTSQNIIESRWTGENTPTTLSSYASTLRNIKESQCTTQNPQTPFSYASTLPTSRNIKESPWTTQNPQTTPSSYGCLTPWIYYTIAICFLSILICVLLVVLLLRGYFSRKRIKANSVNASLWMNPNISDMKTYEETEIDMPDHRDIKDLPIYTETDECPPLMKLSSAPRPSASLGTLTNIKPLGVPLYSTAQAISPLPYAYSTLLSQKPLQTSCPTLLEPTNLSSSVN